MQAIEKELVKEDTPRTFAAYAIRRLERSGIRLIDGEYTILEDSTYTKGKLILKYAGPDIRHYVVGDRATFWLFEHTVLWTGKAAGRIIIPVRHVVFPKYAYYGIDALPNLSYTPVPQGYFTAFEADQWLTKKAQHG